MSEEPREPDPSRPEGKLANPDWSPWVCLLVIPIVLPLFTPLYNRSSSRSSSGSRRSTGSSWRSSR